MSHADFLKNEAYKARILARLTPKTRALEGDFVLVDDGGGGFLTASYRVPFTKGPVSSVYVSDPVGSTVGEYLEEDEANAQVSAVSDTFLFYWLDEANGYLYFTVRKAQIGGGTCILIIEYDLFFATQPSLFYSDPLDDTTSIVDWKPLISGAPISKKSVKDQLIGFSPIEPTSLELINEDQFINPILGEDSLYKARIKCWHCLGDDLLVENNALFIDSVTSNVSTGYNKISISIDNEDGVFDKQIVPIHTFQGNFADEYNIAQWPDVDPSLIGSACRIAFGYNKKIKLANLNYQTASNTQSDNNAWGVAIANRGTSVFGAENIGLIFFQSLIDYGISTTTKIYFTAGEASYIGNFEQNDHILLKSSAMNYTGGGYGGDIRRIINADPAGDGYIELNSAFALNILTTRAARCSLPRAYIERSGVIYKPRNLRDFYTDNIFNLDVLFLNAGYVATLGMGTAIAANESLYGDYYGDEITFGTYAHEFVNDKNHPVSFLTELIVNYTEFSSSDINSTTFDAANNQILDDIISFMAPATLGEAYPTIKELIGTILLSGRLRLFRDNTGKWSCGFIAAPEDNSVTISDDVCSSIESTFNYSDVCSSTTLEYLPQERGDGPGETTATKSITTIDTSAVPSVRIPLYYGITKNRVFKSFHFYEIFATPLNYFLLYIFGRRRGLHKIRLPRDYFNLLINEKITINMERIAGTTFDSNRQSITGVVVEISKGLNDVEVVIDDQTDFSFLQLGRIV